MKKKPAPSITEPPSWFRRETVESGIVDRHDRMHRKITQELVWGHKVSIDGKMVVRGTAYYSLTAADSIEGLAHAYNHGKKTPPEVFPKCRADGVALPKDGGKDQMQFNLLHRETV